VAARVEEKGEGKAAASQGEVRRRGRDIAGRGEEDLPGPTTSVGARIDYSVGP
jgi:hypothetical protein